MSCFLFLNLDVVENRLKVAKNLGATHTVQVRTDATADDLAVEVRKALGSAPDICIDACGAESTISLNMLVIINCYFIYEIAGCQ